MKKPIVEIVGDRRADPTVNVRELISLHAEGIERWVQSEFRGHNEANNIRFVGVDERFRAHLEHSRDTARQREKEFDAYEKSSAIAAEREQKRIDELINGIKESAADVNTQTIATAEALRNNVDTTANTAREKLGQTEQALRLANDQAMDTLVRRIEAKDIENAKKFKELEDARSVVEGSSKFTEPMLMAIVTKLEEIGKFKTGTEVKLSGLQSLGGWGLPLLLTLVGLLLVVFKY